MRDATIADDGALEGRKKPKRKKKINNKNPVVTLIDAFAHVSPEGGTVSASAFSSYSTADSEVSDEEYGVKKKKKVKKCSRKTKKPPKTKNLLLEQENVKSTNVSAVDTSSFNDSFLQSSFLPITDDSGVGVNSSSSSIVSGFYQKCKQISTLLTSSDDDLAVAQSSNNKDSSHVIESSLAKVREKKSKHKETCHKNKKFRPHSSKLRELLTQPAVLDETNNLSPYNNPFNINDIYQVNNINDMFVSSITAPEYEVECETTPLELLTKHDQISITKVSAPQSPLRNVPQATTSLKPNVTLELMPAGSPSTTINNEFKPINEKPAPVTPCQLAKNYLMSALTPAELASQSAQVPLKKNSTASISFVPKLVSIKNYAGGNPFVYTKPKIEVRPAPVIIKPLYTGRSPMPINPKSCKYYIMFFVLKI